MHELTEINRDDDNTNEKSPLQTDRASNEKQKATEQFTSNSKPKVKPKSDGLKHFTSSPIFKFIIALILFLCIVVVLVLSLILSFTENRWPKESTFEVIPSNAFTNVISYKKNSKSTWSSYTDEMTHFVNKRKASLTSAQNLPLLNCSIHPRIENQECYYDFNQAITECNGSNNFGYPSANPCVFLVLSTFPDISNHLSLEDLESYQNLSSHLQIDCQGTNKVDKENFHKIGYFPSQSLNASFFPLDGKSDYQIPFLALKVYKLSKYRLVLIRCRLYLKTTLRDVAEEKLLQVQVQYGPFIKLSLLFNLCIPSKKSIQSNSFILVAVFVLIIFSNFV